jgi:hypothetical protein
MKNTLIILSIVVFALTSCAKKIDNITNAASKSSLSNTGDYVQFIIPKGDQYSNENIYTVTKYQRLTFLAKFDSTAIYKCIVPSNQTDINKLFGFSDNNAHHHEYSARFGWRWSDNALRLFGYIYNKSVMSFKELGTVAIGAENACSITVTDNQYVFTLNGRETSMPRESKTTTAEGYKLYPYFGGDELAPHPISILIKEL